MANLIEKLNTRNFLPTKLPTRVPAEKVNEIIDVINALFDDNGNFQVEQLLCSGDSNTMFEGAPMSLAFRPGDYTFFFEDFIDTASTKAAGNGKFAVAADATAWFVTEVDGGTGQTETVIGIPIDGAAGASAQGGWAEFTTCNNNNDCLSAQLNGESFKLAYGKKLWFETQVAIKDIDKTEFFIGLAISGTDLYGAAGVGVASHVGFFSDADGNIDCSVAEGATQSKSDTLCDFVDGSITTFTTANVVHKLGFYWDGAGTVKFYVDGVHKGTKTDNGTTVLISDALCMSPGFCILTNANASQTLWIDYIYVAQER